MAACCGANMAKVRAEYSPAFFGETLYAELHVKIKAVFDPDNRLESG